MGGGEEKKNFRVGLSRASGHASHYICWCVHACARLMPARLPSSPNEASWLCAWTKPNWRDGTVLALSALYTPPPRSLTPTLPLLQISWRTMDGWAHKADLEMASVFVKIDDVSQIPWPGPELESPQLQPQTCLPGCLPLHSFLHLQQQWCWGLLWKSGKEEIPRGIVKGIFYLTMETETANVTYTYSNYNKNPDR